eukprot:m.422691 g.422691  ORF g.422691 m.422691 type:complete len:134 (+) comp20202_c4_seq4:70-471(+)
MCLRCNVAAGARTCLGDLACLSTKMGRHLVGLLINLWEQYDPLSSVSEAVDLATSHRTNSFAALLFSVAFLIGWLLHIGVAQKSSGIFKFVSSEPDEEDNPRASMYSPEPVRKRLETEGSPRCEFRPRDPIHQ